MEGTTAKAERLLMIYSRLVNGDTLSKQELAQQFHVTERSIQRDMESLRYFFCGTEAMAGYCLRQRQQGLPAGEARPIPLNQQRNLGGLQNPAGEPVHAAG